ncbi:PGF-pre-PGF domain-containing protein [uncultured Methanomethylovorans sp.]|uniref:PGF-pre-PGF domain-containing protein n=1 Tax=uncultured Methanomethylovorans sp. TaxID=183759 RepID=UPI002AA64B01|nr:PGF-pre-PGF domain-containing protein [uncultured Methanomethylovorans sp.]
MRIKLKEASHVALILIITMIIAGISPAQGTNIELVDSLGGDNYDIAIAGNYTYVGQGNDLVILDLTDDTKPSEISRTSTPSTINAIALAGNYSYMANGENGLIIADITDVSAPKITGNNSTGGVASDICVSGNYAYVIGSNGLSIMSISNPSSPTYVSSYVAGEMSDIAISGNNAYIISKDNMEDEDFYSLLIVDITNPVSPTLTGTYGIGEGGSVAIVGNYAYVSSGSGFMIVDVTDPVAPAFAGSYDIGNSVNEIKVSGNYAYLTGYSLTILDITNPLTPVLVSTYDIGNAQEMDIAEDYVYVINSMSGRNNGVVILNITDPAVPAYVGIYSTTHNAYDIATSDNYAYIADYNNGLVIVNITNPTTLKVESSIGIENHPYDIDVAENYAYIANSGLTILNTTNPLLPKIESSYYNYSGDAAGVAIKDNYAYVASIFGGLLILNISDPAAPTFVSNYVTDDAQSVDISGNYAYIANGFSGVFILNISDPKTPVLVGSYNTRGYANDVAVAGNCACVADGNNGLAILNITNPSSPNLASTFDTVGYANDVTISEDSAYVAASDNGLVVVDISNPIEPTLEGSYATGNAFGVAVSDDNAYVADYNDGLFVFHLSESQDSTSPASVTNLKESGVGSSWIRWTWTNPTDADFSHAMIYIDGTFAINTSDQYYNLTKLAEGTTHTIGIRTVDTSGNINSVLVNDTAITIAPDRTSPASVTNLKESAVGLNWINWKWVNPSNADFSHVKVYMNGVFITNTSGKSINSYNSTGLSEGNNYTISIQTVDSNGNINSTMINDSATTVKLPQISNLSGTNISTSSITLVWQASDNTKNVQISCNDIVIGTVSGATTYVDSDLSSDTDYNYTLIPANEEGLAGNAVTINLRTSSAGSSGGSGGGSSTTKSSTGGGGAGSAEDFENVLLKDIANAYLIMNENASYEFTKEGNPIQSISFYSLKNSGEITSTIEVLNDKSKLVNSTPEGSVYKYINIWVGKFGFATEANIKDSKVKFKVASSWMQDMGVNPEEIRLQRYNGNEWKMLPTSLISNNTDYLLFESQTPGFSPFAITTGGTPKQVNVEETNKLQATGSDEYLNNPLETGNADLDKTKPEKSRTWTLILIFLVAGLFVTGHEYLKKQRN